MNEINVERIMDEIRAQIPEQEEGWTALRFEDIPAENGSETDDPAGRFDKRELDKNVTALTSLAPVSFFRPLHDGGIKKLFKRVVRKLIRFCVEPITLEVSAFQQAAARSLQALRRFTIESTAQNRRRDAEISLLRGEVEELRRRIEELERRA